MSQTVFGVVTMMVMLVVMGGVGLWFAWPDLKKIWRTAKKTSRSERLGVKKVR